MPERASKRDQHFLLPPSWDELVPRDHPVRFVEAFMAELPKETRQKLGAEERANERGAPRYAPAILAAIWIYGFMTGVRSSRELERACLEHLPFRWLSGDQCPDHNTLWRWYDRHRSVMHELFKQSVRTAVHAGLVDLAVMAVDGTKLQANAAADRSLKRGDLAALLAATEERITTQTAEWTAVLAVQTDLAIADLEAKNVTGEAPVPVMPAELRTAEALRTRVKAAIAQCDERAAATGTAASQKAARGNVTDPEARWMKTRRGIVPGYNAQAAVVATNERAQSILGRSAPRGRIVVAATVSTQPTDTAQLATVVAAAIAGTGVIPGVTLADAGYFEGGQLAAVAKLGVAVVVPESNDEAITNPYHRAAFKTDAEADRMQCPKGHWLTYIGQGKTNAGEPTRKYGGIATTCRGCPAFGTCTTSKRDGRVVALTDHDEVIQEQRRTRAFAPNRILFRRRKSLIEGVFGTIKTVLGGRQVLVRGKTKVEAEWNALAMGVNLRTLCRIWQQLPDERRYQVVGAMRTG